MLGNLLDHLGVSGGLLSHVQGGQLQPEDLDLSQGIQQWTIRDLLIFDVHQRLVHVVEGLIQLAVVIEPSLVLEGGFHVLARGNEASQNGPGVLQFLDQVEENHTIGLPDVRLGPLVPLAEMGGRIQHLGGRRIGLRMKIKIQVIS